MIEIEMIEIDIETKIEIEIEIKQVTPEAQCDSSLLLGHPREVDRMSQSPNKVYSTSLSH